MYLGPKPLRMRAPEPSWGMFRRLIYWTLPSVMLIIIFAAVLHPGFGRPMSPGSPLEQILNTGEEDVEKDSSPQKTAESVEGGPWEFNLERDELNFGLSDQQCQVCPFVFFSVFFLIAGTAGTPR